MAKFTHLHVHSHYSLLDGLPKIPNLVARTKELGMDSIALTDHGVMYGVIEFYKEAKKAGIKPIIGQELYVTPNSLHQKRPKIDEVRYHLTVLAKNNIGYKNLIALTSKAHLEGFYYKPRVDKELLRKHSDGLIALSGCLAGELARTINSGDMEKAEKVALEYQDIFGVENFYLEIWHHPNIEESVKTRSKIIKLSKKLDIPLVATHDVHYINLEDKEAQDILVAVQTGTNLSQQDRLSLKIDDFYLVPPEKMTEYFADTPEAITNTQVIADKCNVEISLGNIQLPKFDVPDNKTPEEYMRKLCELGLVKRYGKNISKKIRERLEFELGVIEKTAYAEYFLIVQDLVNWAISKKIVVGPGRGSVAGSIVAYLLNITNIDPLKYDLLFERFLNPARISMPDIDLDFADTRRDEVIEYVKEKYGEDCVAQIITFGTMAARAAIRDTGRALGMPYEFCDKLAKMIPFATNLKRALETVAELKQIYDTDEQAKKLLDSAMKLEGVVRHASTHACGVVITKKPLSQQIPLQHASRGDETVITQYEMHAIEDLGLLKMDFLGLKTLSIIEEALKNIEKRHGKKIDIDKIPLDDKKTFVLLQKAQTTGVFQLESGGMKRNLRELKATEFEDIIAMVSLYRPGPMELIPSYIKRKHGKEPITYLHPKMEPILKSTYGIGVYQEQMMRIARDLAGFTLGDADILRKAIGKKIKELLDEQKEKLISGMILNGIDEHTAQAIWNLFPPFARYGFNRSHGAGYAMVAYQTAYLKANYPLEFINALLNADSGDIERISFLTEEAKNLNITVLAPDINESGIGFAIASDNTIRFGLSAIKNVGEAISSAIVEERENDGQFSSIEDFLIRVGVRDLNKKSFESLIKAGAFDNMKDRGIMLANLERLLDFSKESKKAKISGQNSMFDFVGSTPSIKLYDAEPIEKKQRLAWEKELLGLYISDHPLSMFKEKLEGKVKSIKELSPSRNQVSIGGILTRTKKIITKAGQAMIFAELEDLSGKIEVVVFPSILERNPHMWQEENIVLLSGKVQNRDNELKFICGSIVLLEA